MNIASLSMLVAAMLWAHYATPGVPRCVATELPDPACTPGAVDPAATLAVICWTSTELRRHVRVRRAVLAEYGVAQSDAHLYEVDHLVPLELGGSNDVTNLWPEELAMAHVKDIEENRAHALVCAGKASLEDQQRRFQTDWRKP